MDYVNELQDVKLSLNPTYSAPEFKTIQSKKWIAYNDTDGQPYPDKLISYKNNCALHGSIIKNISRQYAGNGFVYDTSTSTSQKTKLFLSDINDNHEDANEVLSKVSSDFKTFGGFALVVVWAKDYKSIIAIEHIDFSKVRCSVTDEQGYIPGYFYSYNWRSQRPETIFIPAYSEATAKENAKQYDKLMKDFDLDPINMSKLEEFFGQSTTQLLYYKPYEAGSFYYPYPDYVGGINAVVTNIMTDQYGMNSMENGLSVDYIVKFLGTYDDAAKIKEAQAFLKQHANATKRKRPIIAFAPDLDHMMQIDNISGVNEDKNYTKINENARDEILMAHAITSPLLVGIREAGSLGGGTELIEAEQIFYKNNIRPYQNQISKVFNKIMNVNGLDEVTIEKLTIFDTNSEIA